MGPLHKPHTAQSQRKSGKSALTTLAPPAANVRCGVVIWSDAVLMKFRTEQCKTVPMALRYFRPLRCHGTYPSSLFASWFTWLAWATEISSGQNTSGGHRSECGARCLTASPARLRVSQGRYRPLADRAFGHAASPRRRTQSPVCPPREHVAPRPLRRIALQSVLARGQNHPSASSVSRVRSRRLPARVGQTYRQTHTHERGSISSGWPPNQPASRIAKLFGKGGARGGVSPVIDGAPVVGGAPGKLLRPASRRLRRP